MHVIQGVYWQALSGQFEDKWAPLSMLPPEPGQKWFPFAFSGSMRTSSHIHGSIVDPFGTAEMLGIEFKEGRLNFSKVYPDMPFDDEIGYRLRPGRERHEWIGQFSGNGCGTGFVRCTIVPITMEDFSHYAIQLDLDLKPGE